MEIQRKIDPGKEGGVECAVGNNIKRAPSVKTSRTPKTRRRRINILIGIRGQVLYFSTLFLSECPKRP